MALRTSLFISSSISILSILSLALGCSVSAPDSATATAALESGESAICAASAAKKIAFTQKAGCLNDGYVEFCVGVEDAALQTKIEKLEPNVVFLRAHGRAGCDLDTQRLGLYPTREAQCVTPHGALDDATWANLCAIASEPTIEKIVPTFFE
jgi:hypothetical protein